MAIRRQCLFVDLSPVSVEGGDAKQAPTEFRLFKMGLNDSESGPFYFDDRSAASVMSEWRRRRIELTADYEHSTRTKAPKGEKSPNSCKAFSLEMRADGLYAVDCKWTDTAKAEIESGEYRYFSPYFSYDDSDRHVTALINFGLTNQPALNGIAPLMAASLFTDEENHMEEIEELKKKVADLTAENATLKARGDRESLAALSVTAGLEPVADRASLTARVRELSDFQTAALSLSDAKDKTEALGRFTAWKGDAAKATEALSRMRDLEQKALDDELDGLMKKADEERKLSPAEAPKFREIALRDGKTSKDGLATLRACIEAKAPVAALSSTSPKPNPSRSDTATVSIPGDVEPFLSHMGVTGAELDAFARDKGAFMRAEIEKRKAARQG